MRVVVPMERGIAIITQAIDEAGLTEQILPVILDIDVFVEREFDPSGDEIWGCLDDLREMKNDIFYKSLTPAAWEKYK